MSKAAMQREHTTQQIQTYSQTTQTNQQIKTCNKDTKKQRSKEINRNKPRHSERQHLTASGAKVVLLCYSSLLFACFFLCLFVFGWIYCLCLFFLLLWLHMLSLCSLISLNHLKQKRTKTRRNKTKTIINEQKRSNTLTNSTTKTKTIKNA